MVGESSVLRGVEHLEEGRSGVAAEIHAQLVDFVEHEERVTGAAALDLLDDAAGHGADVGAAVAADLGLVAHPTEGHAYELAAEGAGDGLPERGLAGAGRAREAEDGAAGIAAAQFDNGEEVENAALDLVETVVVFVEDCFGADDVEEVLGAGFPGKVGQPLEVGARDLVFGRDGRDAGEPRTARGRLRAGRLRGGSPG